MTTGFLFDELYLWHDTGSAASWAPPGPYVQPEIHVENPETKRRLKNLLEVSGLTEHLTTIKPRPATEAEVLRFHTPEYLEQIKRLSAAGGGEAGRETPFGAGGYEIALLAAGGVIASVDAVLDGTVDNVYALVRPPGHHAEAGEGIGFCVFGNVAIAALHARAERGIQRIATVDWDVHFGNGTQSAFYNDPGVLTISIHQETPNGRRDETGEGAGVGFNINVPLPAGSGDGAYEAVIERVVAPALRRYEPELIIIPNGLDASMYDPLGRMMVSSEAYRAMTKSVMVLADELCGGRLVVAHEGGYSSSYVPYCGLAIIEQLSGVRTPVTDPFLEIGETGNIRHHIYPHQEAAIAAAAEVAAEVPTG
jgi:acetoin utilization deacetylase AcuC-like enzyme